MKINLLKRIKNFFKNTLLGGFGAVLPLTLVFLFFRWIFSIIINFLHPVAKLIDTENIFQFYGVYLAMIVIILTALFFIGLVIRTRIGRFFNKVFEDKYLSKIPGYKIIKETVIQFSGKNKSFFKEVVLVDPFNSGTLMTGLITDKVGDYVTVFVPTAPNPTSGNIYHVKKEMVIQTDASVDIAMKSIISGGAGTSAIFAAAKNIP